MVSGLFALSATTRKEEVSRLQEPLSAAQLEALRRIDTCSVSNAIETFGVRLRNAGFADSSIRCVFEDFPPMVGYAATARLRSDEPPMEGRRNFRDRTEWWNSILKIPPPRIVVLEDIDRRPGRGAFIGDAHAAILKALGCVGYVTNGAVRELPALREMGFHIFAGNIGVSHGYAHIFDLGATVEVGNLRIRPGTLLHGDRHGVVTIPPDIAPDIPAAAAKVMERERRVIEFCQSPDFSVQKLGEVIKELG